MRFWRVAFAVVVVVAVGVSALASASPDGLERTAELLGFAGAATDSAASGLPTAGYGIAGIGDPVLSNAVAGLLGMAVVAAFTLGLTRLLGRRA